MTGNATLVATDAARREVASASRDRMIGIALMCATLACFACLDASAKWLAHAGVNPMLTVWTRYAGSVVLVSLALGPMRLPTLVRSRRPWLQAVRSLLLFASTALNFVALRHLQLAETLSIQFATPLLVALLAALLLGERTGPRRLAAIAVGFLGVLVIVRPDAGTIQPAVLLTIGNVLCYSLYIITTRMLAAHDSSATTMIYSGLAGVLLLTPALPWIASRPPGLVEAGVMAGTAVFGGLGHWLLILAHARAPAAVLAPFIYTQLLWSLGLGFLVFGDVPGSRTLLGAGIVIASGAYLLYRERVRGVEPKAAPQA